VIGQERFQHLCFHGVGHTFLGEKVSNKLFLKDDGTEGIVSTVKPERWQYRPPHPHDQYRDVRSHQKGMLRGICRGVGETHIGFIKTDGDRHSPSKTLKAHLREAILHHAISRQRPFLKWVVGINPNNGSFAYFGFLDKQPIPEATGKKLGNEILGDFKSHGMKPEVFPSTNSAQVRLPFRPDQIYLIGDEVASGLDAIQTFWEWDGHTAPWSNIKAEIATAYAALPYVQPAPAVEKPEPVRIKSKPVTKKNTVTIKDSQSVEELRQEPDARRRQLHFGLYLSHVLKRVPTVDELEQAIFDQKMYSEPWDNPARRDRLESIVNFIAQDFDRAKLKPSKPQRPPIEPSRFGKRCAVECPQELPVFSVRNFDPETMTAQSQMVKVSKNFMRKVADLAYHFLVVEPEENDGVATLRFKKNWKLYLPEIPWSESVYRACRDWMHKAGWTDIYDKKHGPNKCWRWRLGTRAKELVTSAIAAVAHVFSNKCTITHTTHNYLCLAATPKSESGDGMTPDGVAVGVPPPRGSP
jgi:hypothetical protein